jgi:hypothetical protein
MARPKLALEQRLNFWVSQETYDFYAEMAIRRKQKVSEFLRLVLDKATTLVNENGEFHTALPMSQDDLKRMMREVAAEEVARSAAAAASPAVHDEDPFMAQNRKTVENTINRDAARRAAKSPNPAAAKPMPEPKRRKGTPIQK